MKLGTSKQILFTKIALPILLALAAYIGFVNRDITWEWEEDVKFFDEQRISIRRVEVRKTKGGGEPSRGQLRATKSTRVIIPDTEGEVVWESDIAPMILERGVPPIRWTMIASPVWCEEHYKYGSPQPPYIQFDYVDGKWINKHVDPRWYGKRANLLMSEEQRAAHDGKKVTAEQISKFNNPAYKVSQRYLAVDPNMKSNCN